MSWGGLGSTDVPNAAEVSEAVGIGDLEAIGPLLPDPEDVYTRTQYESHIRHKDMSGSGLASNDVMTQGEMITWRDFAPRVPGNFRGTHDKSQCPFIVIDLTWDNIGRSEMKGLERYNPTLASWEHIASPGAGATSYRDDSGQARSGSNQYRIRFESEAEWAQTTVNALCVE